MQILILIPSLLIFLYTLYKLGKDDHVFLRRNLILEQFFDIAFIVILFSLLLGQIFSQNNYSLIFVVAGGSLSLYLTGKYKKLPSGRLFDFFVISFLTALPLWFLLTGLMTKRNEMFVYLIHFAFYLIINLIFVRALLPKLMNRSMREGSISIYFLMLFSSFSLAISLARAISENKTPLSFENIISLLMLIAGSALLLLLRRKKRVSRLQ